MKHFTFRLFLIRKLIEWIKGRRAAKDSDEEACRIIIKHGTCRGIDVQCGIMIESSGKLNVFKHHCPVDTSICKKGDGDSSVVAARRWLAEHGIKE